MSDHGKPTPPNAPSKTEKPSEPGRGNTTTEKFNQKSTPSAPLQEGSQRPTKK